MLPTLIGIFTLFLIFVCVLLVLVILMQKPSADAGMGASLGGGAAESAFGGETGNVLTGICVKCIVTFFVLTFLLFIANIYTHKVDSAHAVNTPSLSAIVEEVVEAIPAANNAPAAAPTSGAAIQPVAPSVPAVPTTK